MSTRKPAHMAPDGRTRLARLAAFVFSLLAASAATMLLVDAAVEDGFDSLDALRVGLILLTTAWLAWGAAQAFVGLLTRPRPDRPAEIRAPQPRTVVLTPICNEDPVATFARLAAIDRSTRAAGVAADIAVLSDTRDDTAAARERAAFARLIADTGGEGRIFYRRRFDNHGRKAGNIEDFIRKSGGAYELAVILDADSLMEGETIRRLVARMQADPSLGLLQTLPRILGGGSVFGRAMQFAGNFHGPVFTRGLARMQGATGPFWGHNAIVRVRAFAESCGLPVLSGRPPFGGSILSHDYVEAALLARAAWKVEVDETLDGSYEEGPENILAHARRDRRWCQGNLQHSRLLLAPGLALWNRFVFLQGIFAYVDSTVWAIFLVSSVVATIKAPPPDYFPEPYQLFPVFPDDHTQAITALIVGIGGLLFLPKLAILAEAICTGRARGFGGAVRATEAVLGEILHSSLIAPVMLMYQSRSVLQVLSGSDGGWPANQRGEGRLTLAEGWDAAHWITLTGLTALTIVAFVAPDLTIWLLPVCLPLVFAPLIIAWTSRSASSGRTTLSIEGAPSPVVADFAATLDRWTDGARRPDRDRTPTHAEGTGAAAGS
ncbi:glucans biosynthesis glucosyltransferase MdoH [Tropicimonas sp.]|uniref:glucans biosynthesis glucosyltransferase MdoH n=1 Tax=Tropicimonas sp. TaxID=2067044 RepID=UPI003A8C24FD